MFVRRAIVWVTVIATFGSAMVLGRVLESPGERMASAAKNLLAALPEPLREQAEFGFDDAERLNWHFIPRERKGVALRAMSDQQKELVKVLLESGTSKAGFQTALNVMALEAILREIEGTTRARQIRDPDLYYVSVFGEPSNHGRWGWRIEGHHLCLNYVIENGKVTAATPTFFGANPAKVPVGYDKQGLRTLAREEDLARTLYQSLTGAAHQKATIGAKAPADILTGAQNDRPKSLPAQGISRAELNQEQRHLLDQLIETYARRQPGEVADELLKQASQEAPDQIHFAWAGPKEPGQGHYYRIQAPTFVIEYCNTQNNANHIHSVLRKVHGDFGIRAPN